MVCFWLHWLCTTNFCTFLLVWPYLRYLLSVVLEFYLQIENRLCPVIPFFAIGTVQVVYENNPILCAHFQCRSVWRSLCQVSKMITKLLFYVSTFQSLYFHTFTWVKQLNQYFCLYPFTFLDFSLSSECEYFCHLWRQVISNIVIGIIIITEWAHTCGVKGSSREAGGRQVPCALRHHEERSGEDEQQQRGQEQHVRSPEPPHDRWWKRQERERKRSPVAISSEMWY